MKPIQKYCSQLTSIIEKEKANRPDKKEHFQRLQDCFESLGLADSEGMVTRANEDAEFSLEFAPRIIYEGFFSKQGRDKALETLENLNTELRRVFST